jgi:hypothetical protein
MYYLVRNTHDEEDLQSNYLTSRAGDEDDETAAGLVADFSRWMMSSKLNLPTKRLNNSLTSA